MKRTDNFSKFVKQPKGSAIKEKIKQEKKKEKKERAEAIEAHFARKREERALQRGQGNPASSHGPKRANPKAATNSKYKAKADDGEVRVPSGTRNGKPSYSKPNTKAASSEGRGRSTAPKKAGRTTPFKKKETPATYPAKNTRPQKPEGTSSNKPAPIKQGASPAKTEHKRPQAPTKNAKSSKAGNTVQKLSEAALKDSMPLNKYIAHSGICSRRDAATIVKEGKVTVNGTVISDPGFKVSLNDTIQVSGTKATPSRNFVYILLNKPKDFITTSDDPRGRRTVLDLVKQATNERIYPVGRLDRNTSGVLLLTNDGDLAQKLSHPKHEIKKVYEVKLDRNLTKGDMDKIAEGITLEDGFIAPDVIAYADPKDKSTIGIEIHSGRNRIVRRIFEHMKYDVRALDRVMYAGLTKKNVQRGNWRFLSEKEVRLLKFMNQSMVKK